MVCTLRVQTQVKKSHICPGCPAPVLCRGFVVQGTYHFLERQAESTYLSLPASTTCWCPVHTRDPSSLTIWGFTTFVACCAPQLPPLFLLNPASVLHTDEYGLHLVLDVSSTQWKLRHRGAGYPSRPSLPHSPRALRVSCAHRHQFYFPYVHLLPSLCKAALPQLLTSAGASAVIFWHLWNSSDSGVRVYRRQKRSGARRSRGAACTAVTS